MFSNLPRQHRARREESGGRRSPVRRSNPRAKSVATRPIHLQIAERPAQIGIFFNCVSVMRIWHLSEHPSFLGDA
jgi:hypothetical protein